MGGGSPDLVSMAIASTVWFCRSSTWHLPNPCKLYNDILHMRNILLNKSASHNIETAKRERFSIQLQTRTNSSGGGGGEGREGQQL